MGYFELMLFLVSILGQGVCTAFSISWWWKQRDSSGAWCSGMKQRSFLIQPSLQVDFSRAILKTLCKQSALLKDIDVPVPTGEPGALRGKQSAWSATLSAII